MAERIDIEVADKVSPEPARKIRDIGAAARSSYTAVERLKQQLASINVSAVQRLQQQLNANTNALSRNALANQRLASEQQRTATAAAQAAAATARVSTAQTQGALAAQRLATEQRRTAAATAAAAAAQDRAALAALRLQNASNRAGGAATGLGDGLLRLTRIVAALVGIGLGADAILKAADAYTTLQNKLQVTTDNTQQLTQVTNELFAIARNTRTPVLETTQAFSRFDLAMKGLGASQRESLELTETVNKALIVGGATTGEAAAGLLQLSQAFNKGKLDGDEFRTVMELMPSVADAIAKQMKVTRGELLELAPQGKITGQVLRAAFASARQEIADKFAKTIPTLAQAMQVLRNEAVKTFGEFNKATGFTSALSSAIMFLADNMRVVAIVLATLGGAMLVAFGPTLIGLLGTATRAITAFTIALAANPVGLLIVGLTTAVALFAAFKDDIKTSSDGIVTLGDTARATSELIGEYLTEAIDTITDVWESGVDYLKEIVEDFAPSISESFGDVLGFVKTVVNQIIGFWVGAYRSIVEAWKNFPELLSELYGRAVNLALSSIQRLINATFTPINAIIKTANQVASLVGGDPIADLVAVNLDAYKVQIQDTSGDVADYIKATFERALSTDFIGDAVDAIQDRARQLANQRIGPADALRGPGRDLTKKGDGKPDKEAEKRALALAKINAELDKELQRMQILRPERDIQQRLDEIEISLMGRKIKLNNSERESIRNKIAMIETEKVTQSERDRILEAAIAPQRDYSAGIAAVNQLLALGVISAAEAGRETLRLKDTYEDATNPLIRINRELDDQLKLLKFVGREQIVQQQLQQITNAMRAQGRILTQDETQSILERLRQVERETAINRELNRIYDDTAGAHVNIVERMTATHQAMQAGFITLDDYKRRLVALTVEAANLRLKLGTGDVNDVVLSSVGRLVEGYEGVLSGLSESFGDFFQQLNDGFADSIGRAIVYSEDLGTALQDVAKSALAELISSLVKLGIQYVINAALGQSVGAATTAASVAMAGATAAAWAPAAAMASLASFGANAAPAMAGLTATSALASTLATLGGMMGFEQGGFTGNGGKGDIAGVVHGQEFVVNAGGTARNREALEAMNRGARFTRSKSASKREGVAVYIENYGTSKEYEVQQLDENSIRLIARDEAKTAVVKHAPRVVSQQIADPNSSISKSMANNTKTQRKR